MADEWVGKEQGALDEPAARRAGTPLLVETGARSTARPPLKYWSIEDRTAREQLPLYETIPAATAGELTPSNGLPKRETYLTWHRSHGDNGGTRFSLLDQINRDNVASLQVAWAYHSRDGKDNLQCNPVIVNRVMYTPTPGKFIVAVHAETGAELWRFKPEGRPAWRSLLYWPGDDASAARLMFCSGKHLYALNPANGQPIASFGERGRTLLPGVTQGDFGAELWSARLPYVGNSPPAAHQVNGRQYVVISASGGNKLGTPYGDAWLAFALPRY